MAEMETRKVAQKSALGKGLASLLPGAAGENQPTEDSPRESAGKSAENTGNQDRHPGISLAKADDILINPYQPRREFDETALEELTSSLKSSGMIQPLVVRKTDKGYELIAGERRLRAARRAGMKQVPIVIRRTTDRESLELALVENIQRRDLNCVEEALAYLQLMQDFNLTQEEVAKRVGKDRATVANHLRLLKLPETVLGDLKSGKVSFGHGKALVALEDPILQERARARIVTEGLSVRATEELISEFKAAATKDSSAGKTTNESKGVTPTVQRLKSLAQELTRHWSTKVEIKGSEKKGKIVLHYATREELERLLSSMQN